MRLTAIAAAAMALSACFIEPRDRAPDDRPLAADRALYGAQFPAVEATDAFLSAELSRPDRAEPSRLDRTARLLGLSGGAELAAAAAGDCLSSRDLARFSAARSLEAATAAVYLRRRFGVKVCPGAL
jgi:hypothetical protein